jgi:hypothetical protein
MKNKKHTITKLEFFSKVNDPLTYYNCLPSDGILVEHSGSGNIDESIDYVLSSQLQNLKVEEIDNLLVLLNNNFEKLYNYRLLINLGKVVSIWYSSLLKDGKKNRPLRMKLQLLNFYIRDILDKDKEIDYLYEEILENQSPWDKLETGLGQCTITSDSVNFHAQAGDGALQTWRCGLPSQLDEIIDGKISIGSIFSNGGWVYDWKAPLKIEHDRPIVIFFSIVQRTFFLDVIGKIYCLENLALKAKINLNEASKCRLIDNILFIFDWTVPNTIISYDIDLAQQKVIYIEEILIGNDICKYLESYYVIDKQQGYIFKFNLKFELIEKKLCFGKSEGRLFDPISIRIVNNRLQIVSWITNKVIYIDLF